MKLLSKRPVREKVIYSPAHIARLEAAGQFPKRVSAGAVAVVELGEPVLKAGVVPAPVLHELEQIVGRQGTVRSCPWTWCNSPAVA